MQYIVDTIIDRPVDEVVSLFDSTENLKEWMEGLEEFEHLEGTPGEVGARSRLRFKMGEKEVEMIETIIEKNLPAEFTGTYTTEGVFNSNRIGFQSTGANQTRMTMNTEFKFESLPMKLMGLFVPFIFKKQSRKNLEAFKAFAERS